MDKMPDFQVRDGIWMETAKVVDVQRRRHTIITTDRDKPTAVTFCNNCGSAFTRQTGECASCGA